MNASQPANPLLIVGATARAAAWSALRGGFQPWTIDCFADSDLSDRAWARRMTDYPGEALSAASHFPLSPWMYSGAIENYPQLVDQLSAVRPLYGNSGEVLRQVRDPWQLQDVLRSAGFATPELSHQPPAVHQRWLQKNYRSAAGLSVRWARPLPAPDNGAECYYQQFLDGTPWSSLYVAADHRAVLLGAARQWIGEPRLGAKQFLYSGSFTARRLPVAGPRLEQLGNVLAARFSLVGLFGVDWILSDRDIWPLEVNPRYTASCELFERACQWPLIQWHVSACRQGTLPDASHIKAAGQVFGKGILYADQQITVTERAHDFLVAHNRRARLPAIADIPHIGETIEAAHPLVTLFADGANRTAVKDQILDLAIAVRRGLVG